MALDLYKAFDKHKWNIRCPVWGNIKVRLEIESKAEGEYYIGFSIVFYRTSE